MIRSNGNEVETAMAKIGCSECGKEWGKSPGCRCTDNTDRFAGYVFLAFIVVCMAGAVILACRIL